MKKELNDDRVHQSHKKLAKDRFSCNATIEAFIGYTGCYSMASLKYYILHTDFVAFGKFIIPLHCFLLPQIFFNR